MAKRLSRRRLLQTLAGLPFMGGLARGALGSPGRKRASVSAIPNGRRKRAGINSIATSEDD